MIECSPIPAAASAPRPPAMPAVAGRQLRIGAVALACGGELGEELAVCLGQLSFWAPHLPVYLLTDDATLAAMEPQDRARCAVVETLPPAELEELGQMDATDAPDTMAGRWSRPWIGAKLEALRRALARWPGKGVLLCDSDIVVADRITETVWRDCDAVLSAHRGPSAIPMMREARFGVWNAGMVLTDSADFVERWIALYRAGEGGFYEQKCLETLSREFACEAFPASWNWGFWRGHCEDLGASGRRPATLHCHVVGPLAGLSDLHGHGQIEVAARREIERVRISRALPDRQAFVHFSKAGGSSLRHHLLDAARERGYQFHDSWPLDRDWDEGELAHILRGTGAGHLRWRSLVHNHAQNWSAELAELARREGYRLFALHRPVRDRLVSFHHWHRGKVAGGEPCIGGPAGDAADLDTFLRIFVSRPCYSVDWALPDWAGLIDHWYPATGEGIARCLSEMLAMEVEPVRHNASASRGWAAAVESGEVSPETAALVDGDARVRAWDRWEEGLGARSIRPAPDYQPSTIN